MVLKNLVHRRGSSIGLDGIVLSLIGAILIALSLCAGCTTASKKFTFYDSACAPPVDTCGTDVQTLTPENPASCFEDGVQEFDKPAYLDPSAQIEYRGMTLDEAIQHALSHAKIMRDLGGTLIHPETVPSIYDPALVYSNARQGEEAALAAFDASLHGQAYFENVDRQFNNQFIGTDGALNGDLGAMAVELNKTSAVGSRMAVRHIIDYDYNNNIGNMFGNPSGSYQAYIEGEVRQPLLQGAGAEFNRIAGPDGSPGSLNGVLLARVRTDISLAEFEIGVRNLVANVENAYWDLYFAYRDLDAKMRARDTAFETYQFVSVAGRVGLKKEQDVGQALEQYWRFQSDALDAMNGRTVDGTRTNNGSGGGTVRGPLGVQLAERRLRLIIGMPINGGALIRPSDQPVVAPVDFEWATLASQAIVSRPELRRQRWVIKQHELQLIANRNLLLPQLDMVGRYRTRGFGEDLISQSNQRFSSAYGDMATGEFQEWQVGVELDIPLGFRAAHNATRNTEHALARERAILHEQKRDIVFGLSNAASEVRRAFEVASAQYNRFAAAQRQIDALQNEHDVAEASLIVLLEAQRRRLETEIQYHEATVDYILAMRNVYFESGTLLDYRNIHLNEGWSPAEAYCDARELVNYRTRPLNYVHRDITISEGPIP